MNFDEIYKKYQRDIYTFIFSMIRDIDSADDICQDVFHGFYLNIDSVEDPEKYLYQSARNRTKDFIRKKNRKDIFEHELITTAQYLEERQSAHEKAHKIAKKFAKNEIEAFMYVYKELHNFTFKEIRIILLKDFDTKLTDRQIGYALTEMKQRIATYVIENNITDIEDLY